MSIVPSAWCYEKRIANSKVKNPTTAASANKEGKASTDTPEGRLLSKGNLKTTTCRHTHQNQSGHFAITWRTEHSFHGSLCHGFTDAGKRFMGTRPLNPSQKPTEVQADAAADQGLDALGLEAAAAQEAPERVAA
jgi:hypothetical protein